MPWEYGRDRRIQRTFCVGRLCRPLVQAVHLPGASDQGGGEIFGRGSRFSESAGGSTMRSGRRSVEIGVIQNVERLAAQLSVWSRPDRRHTVAGAGIEFLAGPSSRIASKSKREQETCSRLPGDWYVRPYAMAGVVETGVFVS